MEPYLDSLSPEEAVEYLELHLLTYEPEDFVLQRVQTVRDIYEYRSPLKTFRASDRIISHVAGIIVAAIDQGLRMRTLDCLKVLRSLAKSSDPSDLKPSTIKKLFKIYQVFIFRENEDIQWCVSAILKDKPLPDSAIDWLIQNCHKSEHIVNRLLLYPGSHRAIRAWAEQVYRKDELLRRRSEVIAALISPGNADSFAQENDANTLVWAIFKAHISKREKVALLKQYSTFEAFASIVDIADRLESSDLLRHFLGKLRKEGRANHRVEAT